MKQEGNLETLSDRLVYALDYMKIRKTDLAREVGVSPQVIHRLCNTKTHSTRFACEIATALKINLKWLSSGEPPMLPAASLKEYTAIPILEKIRISDFIENKANYRSNDHTEYFYLRRKTQSVFATKVPDSSMEPLLKKGCVIAIDTNFSSINKDDVLLIYMPKFDEYLIRSPVIHGDNVVNEFMPINTDIYKPVTVNDTVIIGRMIAYSWEELL